MSDVANRREKLFDVMDDNSVAVIYAGKAKIASEDEFYPFVCNRNFYYLTNIEQENSILLLIKSMGEKKTYLFIDEANPSKERWTGKKLTNEQANELSDIKNIFTTSNFEAMFDMALVKDNNSYGPIDSLYIDMSKELKIDEAYATTNLANDIKNKYPHIEIKDVYPLIVKLRMVKSQEEIEKISTAIEYTHSAINDLLINMKVGTREYALADRFEFYGRSHYQAKLSFSTIVAAGKNATVLHHPYSQQQDIIQDGDLVLFDLGLAKDNYCADVSRTYPINGEFTGKQKDIYETVLTCNKAVIEYAKSGLTIKDLQDFAIEILTKECINRGLMDKDDDIKKYYYHNVSHHLGLDTHDASFRELPLQAGNVITVEPGLYFADLGIGVRIEDDIVITDDKAIVLTKSIKKELDDIEKMFRNRATL